MYNYLIYNEYKYPAANPSYMVNNQNLSTGTATIPGTQNSPNSLILRAFVIDGIGNNLRKVTFTLAAPAAEDYTFLIVGSIFNGSEIKESVTINMGATTADSGNLFYLLDGIYPPANKTIPGLSIGFSAEGYTALTQANGCKTDHFVTWESGTADVTVYGSMDFYLNQNTTLQNLKEFPLSGSLTNITSTMTSPEYYLLPVGFFRLKVEASTTASLIYRVGIQTLMN